MNDKFDYAHKLDSKSDPVEAVVHNQNDMCDPGFNRHFHTASAADSGSHSDKATHLDFGATNIYGAAGDDKPPKSARINLDKQDKADKHDRPVTPVTQGTPTDHSTDTSTTSSGAKTAKPEPAAPGSTATGDGKAVVPSAAKQPEQPKYTTQSLKTADGAYTKTTDAQGNIIDAQAWDKVGNHLQFAGPHAPGGAYLMNTDYAGYPRSYIGSGGSKAFSYFDSQKGDASLPPAEFAKVAKETMARADVYHTGAVTKNELAKAIEDPSYKGPEAQALAGLYKYYDSLANLSGQNGEKTGNGITDATGATRATGATGATGITTADLDKFEQVQAAEQKRAQAAQNIKAGDGDNVDKVTNGKDSAKMVNGIWGSGYFVNEEQKHNSPHDLFADRNNPLHSITPDGIHQGSSGDCYFLAPLAALAKAHPETIKDAIKDNENGTYTVRFPGAKDEPVTVKAPTTTEMGLYNHSPGQGTWASVMEKAYGEYRQTHDRKTGPLSKEAGNLPQEGAGGGGSPADTIKLLTGHDASFGDLKTSPTHVLSDYLQQAVKDHKTVTAGISEDSLTPGKFFKNHCYSITDFKADGNGGGQVTVRNPWGGANGTTSGELTLPIDKFIKQFDYLTYEH
jgi:hypothetical protein